MGHGSGTVTLVTKLSDVDADALRDALDEVDSAKAAKRLVVALEYKDGTPVSDLSERYGIPRSTLYYWLDRFEEFDIPAAIEDEPRPGRPRKLDDADRRALESDLADAPADHGYDAEEWTPELVQRHIEERFDTTYSVGHVRRLLREELT